jgi:secreted trypsin-like serine protease
METFCDISKNSPSAHCTSTGVTGYLLIAGAYNRVQIEPHQQRRQVSAAAFISHPEYGPVRLVNDIAVIRVAEAFTFNTFVQPIILASDPSELHVGASVQVSGFGRYSDSHTRTSEVVLFTVKTVISNAQCSSTFPVLVVASTICAIGEETVNNAVCNGDSGGPLSIIRNNESYQVGVVSFGSPLG